MESLADIEELAEIKFREAECLLANGFYDGAYYLGGYVIELLLKARICQVLEIDNFFQEEELKKLKYPQAFRTHNLEQLLKLSGLETKLVNEGVPLIEVWTEVLKWNEASRYIMNKKEEQVKDFLTAIKNISVWIRTN